MLIVHTCKWTIPLWTMHHIAHTSIMLWQKYSTKWCGLNQTHCLCIKLQSRHFPNAEAGPRTIPIPPLVNVLIDQHTRPSSTSNLHGTAKKTDAAFDILVGSWDNSAWLVASPWQHCVQTAVIIFTWLWINIIVLARHTHIADINVSLFKLFSDQGRESGIVLLHVILPDSITCQKHPM